MFCIRTDKRKLYWKFSIHFLRIRRFLHSGLEWQPVLERKTACEMFVSSSLFPKYRRSKNWMKYMRVCFLVCRVVWQGWNFYPLFFIKGILTHISNAFQFWVSYAPYIFHRKLNIEYLLCGLEDRLRRAVYHVLHLSHDLEKIDVLDCMINFFVSIFFWFLLYYHIKYLLNQELNASAYTLQILLNNFFRVKQTF